MQQRIPFSKELGALEASGLNLLDEVRAVAQMGLYYTLDEYDRGRYRRLLELAAKEYAAWGELPDEIVLERFQAEIGQVTPKVGVNGIVMDRESKLLLERRADDGCWGIPGGWAEVGESAEDSLIREFREETGLEIAVGPVIGVYSRLPGEYGQPHTSYHLLYGCGIIQGELRRSNESLELGFYDWRQIQNWHRDHWELARRGWEALTNQMK